MSRIDRDPRRPDPLIDEIRSIRGEIVAQCGNDLDKLCDHLQDLERRHADRMYQSPDKNPADNRPD